MALRRADGSVMSENTPSRNFEASSTYQGIYRVILTGIHYVDDVRNIYGKTFAPQVVYDGVLIGGKSEGQSVSNIKDSLAQTGESQNYGERIYKICSKPLTGSNSAPLNKQDGAIVYVAFVNGDSSYPIIVGRDKSSLDRIFTGATSVDGPRRRWQYNGIFFEVNKNGEMTLKRKGGTYDAKGQVFNQVETGNEVYLNWTKNKMVLNIGNNSIQETRDGIAEKMTLNFKSGLSVTIDGGGDAVKILTKGGGEINIVAGKLAIGANGIELLQQISDQLADLITMANAEAAHTHIGNLGYPTAVPSTAGDWSSLAGQLGTIKGNIDGIKGTL